MPITTEAKEGVLTIRIGDDRLVEPSRLAALFKDIQAEMNKAAEDRVILDFAAVSFLASSALGQLVQIQKKAKELKLKLKLSGISPEIFEVFKITKLHKMFDIAKDEAAARKAHLKTGFFR